MTRDEEIYNAKNAFYQRALGDDYYYDPRDCFEEGARWTDDNPKLSWIRVEDSLPEQDEEVIVLCGELNTAQFYKISFAHIVDKTMCKDYNGWNIPNVVYWYPMPKLTINKIIVDKTMTRDEEICNAINNLQIGVYDENNPLYNDEYDGSDMQNAFYLGAKWADENPKSPWINVNDDLPCFHEELICGTEISEGTKTIKVFAINEHNDIWTDYMIYENYKWRWNDFEPDFWMIAQKVQKLY